MTKRSKEELIEILDNIIYWDSCPELYKEKIPDLITEIKALTIPVVSNNEVALKAFVEEYVEAFEDGQGSDTALYRQAKSLL